MGKKIPGVSPLKNAPADYGFDPLGFAKVSYPRFGLPEDELLRTNNLRDAELRHGRLAMLPRPRGRSRNSRIRRWLSSRRSRASVGRPLALHLKWWPRRGPGPGVPVSHG